MTISELSVRRPVLMTMIYVLIMVIAAVFLGKLDIALYPDIDMPLLSVMVDCEDAGPEEIEQQVAKVLENNLSSIENLNTITSISQEDMCIVILEFEYGTDLDEAEDDVQSYINMASVQLPDWAETPQVVSFDAFNNSVIMRLTLSGDNMTVEELQTLAEDDIEPLLERIEGVGEAEAFGGSEIEYDVLVDPNRLGAYGLTFSQVASALAVRNIQSTSGEITYDDIDYQITVDGRLRSIEDMENTVITTINDYPVLVKDVADVIRTTSSTRFRESYYNGNQVVTINISNDSESNETTVAEAVRKALPEIVATLPEGVYLEIQSDSTEMISSTMSEVYSSAVEGVLLAAAVIFLFLRGIKSTIIIALSMPVCILITLMVMSIADISINSMSMSGLILGIGMIVDASIIILENTYSFRQQGEKSAIAAILGSKNMFTAIVASTLTTLCVFVPIIIFKYELEMIGVMFQDLVITVCISLACSLFVAVTLVPALSGSILRINTRTQKPLKNRLLRKIDDSMTSLEEHLKNTYVKVLGYFLDHRLLLIALLVLLLLFSISFFSGVGLSLTPEMTTDDEVSMKLTLDPGTTNSVTREYLFRMEQRIKEVLPEKSYESIMIEVGSSNTGSLTIYLPDITEQTVTAPEIENILRQFVFLEPEATWIIGSGRDFGGSSIDVEIHSEDSDLAKEVADDIVAILQEHVPQAIDVESDLDDGAPKYEITIDYDKAKDLGISVSDISTTIQAALTGITATELTTFSTTSTYDLVVKLADEDTNSIEALNAITIPTENGDIRLDSIAAFTKGTAPKTITREDKIRVNHVTADLAEGFAASTVQELVDAALDEYLVLPDGVEIVQSGEMADFAEYLPTLVMIIILALFLVYAVMAAQFESLTV